MIALHLHRQISLCPLETNSAAASCKESEIKQRSETGLGENYRTEPTTGYEADGSECKVDNNLG